MTSKCVSDFVIIRSKDIIMEWETVNGLFPNILDELLNGLSVEANEVIKSDNCLLRK